MKFQQYLIETKLEQYSKIIINTGLPVLYGFLETCNWKCKNENIADILEYTYEKNNIKFVLQTSIGKGKFFTNSYFYNCNEIELEISRKNNISNYLFKNIDNFYNFNNNIFLKEFFIRLSHELVHRQQFSKGKWNNKKCEKMEDYLSDPIEIEAFAYEAAIEMKNYKTSDTLNMYKEWFGKNHKIYQQFIKLYQKNLKKLEKN